MNAYWYSIQQGFKPRLNEVKASGGCHRFAKLDKIWAQIGQGAFDTNDSQTTKPARQNFRVMILHFHGRFAYGNQHPLPSFEKK
ncbi:hypothetical protein J6TS1_16220 [Siminovitchia terrae]|uniref:Uncharacterized protein n=2 Tax=Siminovitchia terrae TaxID=1914933 RepID=A0A429X940_SIMTE|nr:hypothetical protein [Siminovitchia terrae]RST59771.1 hypothetical protein D5F11_010165 [Siminovitchia terrae]GIN91661.1 hypothetical protein J22TS1_27120 [Siminovitchia terrae]GIN95752.1 hypothetical protein J6TS1_16220 [Siminovitchia terrae]